MTPERWQRIKAALEEIEEAAGAPSFTA